MEPTIFHVLFEDYTWNGERLHEIGKLRLCEYVCVWRGKLSIYTIQDAFGIFK